MPQLNETQQQMLEDLQLIKNNLTQQRNTIFKKKGHLEDVINKIDDIYGLIINNKYKVSNDKIIFKENTNYGYHNEWGNMLWVYLQNKNNF